MKKGSPLPGIGASVGMLILILDSKTALEGAKQGIGLCLRTVIPSLFPFFILSGILTGAFLGAKFRVLRPLGRLCGIPEGAESLLLVGFLGGYPVGAQNIAQACRTGQLRTSDAERMLAFCNNAGPAFLFGMAAGIFPRQYYAWKLWAIHIFSALMTAALLPGRSRGTAALASGSKLTISGAMTSSVKVMAAVCGWIVVFRVIIAFLQRWILWLLPAESQITIIGLLELSNGCCELPSIADISQRFLICSGFLAFGGLCVTMQTVSVTQGLSLRFYFSGKLIQTLLSLLLSEAFLHNALLPFSIILGIFALILWKIQKKSSIPEPAGV